MIRLTKHLVGIAVFTGIAIAWCGVNARAQGSRKDDIVFNAQGRPMAGATVRVCTSAATGQPCTPLALIYSDAGLTQALANPISTDGMGNYTFYAAPGRYEIEISGPAITTKQIPNVILPNDPSSPTFATVTTTSGISAFSLSLAGNLTVNGSAAVTGTLTVGGAPLPSVNADNQWTSSQRFKGPDPWRDITAYMPAGGCDNSALTGVNHSYGAITAGTNTLTLGTTTYESGFVNGCGIFLANAGPVSTLSTPSQGLAPNPNVIGAAGSTTVHYKVAAIDSNYGTSAASAAITITTAPSTRTPINYVGIYWTSVANAVGYLIYTDQNGGGTYVPLGYSFDCSSFAAGSVCGAIDKGVETYSWAGFNGSNWPQTPPAAATNQALITTIVSGGGTLNLVLAANATNTIVNQTGGVYSYILPDNSMFIASAIAAAASDGNPQIGNKGTVFIPEGLWYTSTIPFPSSGIAGVKILLGGALEIFGLPVEGNIGTGGTSGQVSITGNGGAYAINNWTLSCSSIGAYPTLGALFVTYGPGSGLDLSHLCLTSSEAVIIQDSQGDITTQDVSFAVTGSGPMLQVDNNAFFSLFDRTNWNDGANTGNTQIPAIWFLGLTNSGITNIFDFRDNSFISHAIRVDQAIPGGGGPFENFVFDGTTVIENNADPCFICYATNNILQNLTIDNVITADPNTSQSLVYSYSPYNPPLTSLAIHGQTIGFTSLDASVSNPLNSNNCRNVLYDNPNQGGGGTGSIGYFGSIFGSYSGCDNGATLVGYDVQTSEVLTSGGNDSTYGPAGEQMIGHVFRRPQTTLTPSGSGGTLAAAPYYIQVTMLDVAGRESAPSPEVSATTTGSTSSIGVSAATGIYFPTSCNVYYGTTPGGEAHYWNSTSISNGTCTFSFTTTTSPTGTASPRPVGNAMRSWLTEENNANSCLFCGSSNAGTGFLGMFLTRSEYAAAPAFPALVLGTSLSAPNVDNILYVDGVKYTTVAAAVAACPTPGVVEIPPSSINYPINSNLTVPSTCTLRVDQGAVLAVATSTTLAIQGNLVAGRYTIFSLTGSGIVSFSGNKGMDHLFPEWWGAAGDGVTDDRVALQNTWNAAKFGVNPRGSTNAESSLPIQLACKTYLVASSPGLNFALTDDFHIEGCNQFNSRIQVNFTAANTVGVDLGGDNDGIMKNMSIICGTSSANAPTVCLLQARDSTDTFNANGGGEQFQNVSVQGYSPWMYYNYRGEGTDWIDSQISENGTSGTPVTLSEVNTAGVTSPNVTFGGVASMTLVNFSGAAMTLNSSSTASTSSLIYLDEGSTYDLIGSISYSGFLFLQGQNIAAIRDTAGATGTIANVTTNFISNSTASSDTLVNMSGTANAWTLTGQGGIVGSPATQLVFSNLIQGIIHVITGASGSACFNATNAAGSIIYVDGSCTSVTAPNAFFVGASNSSVPSLNSLTAQKINVTGNISGSETTAPSGVASVDQLYADSTAHRWKKIENNGAVQTVGSADSSACAYQGPGSAITGTGAAAVYYTCTLPAGVMGAGQGIIITALAKHTTGTAAVTYTLSFGGTSTTAAAPAGAANQLERITYLIMNNPGSTNAQTISTVGQDSNAGSNSLKLDTAAVNTASAVTINLQFSVAATDAITPEMFLVELKQ